MLLPITANLQHFDETVSLLPGLHAGLREGHNTQTRPKHPIFRLFRSALFVWGAKIATVALTNPEMPLLRLRIPNPSAEN